LFYEPISLTPSFYKLKVNMCTLLCPLYNGTLPTTHCCFTGGSL
jgi:hypothetical protein